MVRRPDGMSNSILLVHPEPRIRRFAAATLSSAGYDVRVADYPAAGGGGQPDVVLAAWSGPGAFAAQWARIAGESGAGASRIILMAPREELGAAAAALDEGIDDCIGVPFAPGELLARIRACLRRPAAGARRQQVSSGRVMLDLAVHRVLVDGRPIALAPTEFRLLAFFLENQGRVFSRDELLRRAWAKNIKAGLRTVDVHVRRLRQQLEPFGCERMIQTVRGFGYRFAVESAAPGARTAQRALTGSGSA